MTADEVRKVMRRINRSYPGTVRSWEDNPKAALEMWVDGIGDLPFDVTDQVMIAWVREEDKPPTIAQLRRAVADRVYKVPTLGSAMAIAKKFVKSGEQGRCPRIVMYALDKIGRPRQVRSLSDFAFEKAFTEAWEEVQKEARTAVIANLPELAAALARGDRVLPEPAPHLALAQGESQIPRLEEP